MKLCLCQLILSDCNVLVLDEPTNYLDLPSLRALERMLGEYPGTVLLVSHDPVSYTHLVRMVMRISSSTVRRSSVVASSART